MGRVREEKRREEERRSQKRKHQKKEDPGARKGRKVPKHYVFPMICGSGGSKSRLAKAAGAEPADQIRDEKLHAVVARSAFPSQNVQSTLRSESTFGSWDIKKSAHRCGAKHVWKSKCTKHLSLRALVDVQMSKKCTPLWREAHLEVKSVKNWRVQSTFGSWNVEKVHAVVARSTCPSQNVENTPFSDHFWKLTCRKSTRRCGAKHISKSKCTKHTFLEHFLKLGCGLVWQAQGILHPAKSEQNVRILSHFQKRWQAWDIRRGSAKMHFARQAVQETCSSEMLGGQGADFMREVAFWSIGSSGLLRWFCVTGAALRTTWPHFCMAGAVL